jgi:hypothetical protein
MRRLSTLLAVAFLLWAPAAFAQDHSFPTPGNASVGGVVQMCLNSSGNAVPVSSGQCTGGTTVALPTTPTIANGNGVVPAPSAEAGAGLSTGASSALAANLVVKASAGNLYSFNVSADSTLSGAAWWLMIYNATAAPSDGAVTPAKCYAFPSGTTGYSAAFPAPVAFGTGIVLGVSTTGCFTKTASTHAFISGDFK